MAQNTRQKIVDTALTLFNLKGADQVSIRDVASKAGISHGNLCYYFPNIENLVENLYLQLAAEQDELFIRMTAKDVSLQTLKASSKESLTLLYKYRFLMLDFVAVMRKSKQVRAHYRHLFKLRKDQFRNVFAWMIAEGYLRPEMYPGHYEKVIEQMFIVGDFWMASSEILYDGKEKDKIAHYADIIDHVLFPYLTPKAMQMPDADVPSA
jgi:AcrR family transcriptional regulator